MISRPRRGTLLLEALVGLTLLAVAGLAGASLAIETTRAATRAAELDRETSHVARFLAAASTWSARELELHVGERIEGAWRVSVLRLAPALYRISVRRNDATGAEVLTTVVFQREVNDEHSY